MTAEQVVLLDEYGEAAGTALKSEVHHADTPLHLAFSTYVFSPTGELLITQRALHKPTWPGIWTNSCCGHPAPGEALEDAVRRRVQQELRMELATLRLVLPAFRYRAVMPDGVVENEMCPVYVAVSSSAPRPNPAEVAATRWVDWPTFRSSVLDGTADISPWCLDQVAALPVDPVAAVAGSVADLPPAARVSLR